MLTRWLNEQWAFYLEKNGIWKISFEIANESKKGTWEWMNECNEHISQLTVFNVNKISES